MLCLQIINVLLVLGLTNANDIANNKFKNGQKFIKTIIDAKIWSSLHYRSVYINEVEKISVETFRSNVSSITDKNMNRVLLAFVITLKCQCAHNIIEMLVSIFIEYCLEWSNGMICSESNKVLAEYWKHDIGMSLFKFLNDMIALIIDTIFQINEIIPTLKSNEPSFLKKLLSMQLYFSNLLKYTKNMEEKNGNNISTENNTIPELGDGKEHNDDDRFITDLDRVLYMISQMENLLNGFKIRNCYSGDINEFIQDDENNKNAEIETQQKLLTNLNLLVRSFYKEGSMALDINVDTMTKYNMYDAMLYNLLADPVAEDNVVIILDYTPTEEDFIKYLIKARVKYDIDKPDNEVVSIKNMFKQCIRTYDIEVHYNYASSVYGVLLKIIYEKLHEIIENIILNKEDTDKKPKFYKKYSDSLTELQTIIDLPIDAFGDINLLLTYGANQIDGAKAVVENRLKSLSHIILLPERVEYSLEEIVGLITDNKFQQFWWVFNTLHLVKIGKKSDYVYGTSLKLASTSFLKNNFYKLHYECETLKNIYYNFFRINLIIKSFKDSKSEDINMEITRDDNVFLKVHNYNQMLSDHLYELIEVWFKNENLKLGDDLFKILMTMFIRLKNTEYHIDVYNKSSNNEYKFEILNKNIDDLTRVGDYIMNLLDNYLIGKCVTVNNRRSNYSYFTKYSILSHDIHKCLLLFNIPTKQFREDKDYMILDYTEKSESINYLSEEWYVLLFFVEENQFINAQKLRLIIKYIHFNYNGYIIDMTGQRTLSKFTFSLNYLVEYASNFFKSIFCSMYFLLVIYYCENMKVIENKLVNQCLQKKILINDLTQLVELNFPNFCKPYIDFIMFMINILKQAKDTTKTVYYEIENLMLAEIEKLGVVNVKTTLRAIHKNTKMDDLPNQIKTIIKETGLMLETLHLYEIMYGKNPTP